MKLISPKCIKCVDAGNYVKNGKSKNGKQRYKCKGCGKSFLADYTYKAYYGNTNQWIINLHKESAGIRSIARLLNISPTTVLSRIKYIASVTTPPLLNMRKEYEVDELCTYVGAKSKRRYIAGSVSKVLME